MRTVEVERKLSVGTDASVKQRRQCSKVFSAEALLYALSLNRLLDQNSLDEHQGVLQQL